jgi:hypothetical protein
MGVSPHTPLLHASEQHCCASSQGEPFAAQNRPHSSEPRGPPGSHRPLQHDERLWHSAPGGEQVPGGRQYASLLPAAWQRIEQQSFASWQGSPFERHDALAASLEQGDASLAWVASARASIIPLSNAAASFGAASLAVEPLKSTSSPQAAAIAVTTSAAIVRARARVRKFAVILSAAKDPTVLRIHGDRGVLRPSASG